MTTPRSRLRGGSGTAGSASSFRAETAGRGGAQPGYLAASAQFSDAKEVDLPAIVAIMNAAFRGTSEVQSWCVETGFIAGNRTNELLLREEITGGARFFLIKEDVTSALQGCVSLQTLSPERWYLGSLTVDPALQNTGFGRKLLRSAEEYAVAYGACTMELTVVNVRAALISWYERRGYHLTGETRPFPYGDNRFGIPTRDDLEFVVLEKDLRE